MATIAAESSGRYFLEECLLRGGSASLHLQLVGEKLAGRKEATRQIPLSLLAPCVRLKQLEVLERVFACLNQVSGLLHGDEGNDVG